MSILQCIPFMKMCLIHKTNKCLLHRVLYKFGLVQIVLSYRCKLNQKPWVCIILKIAEDLNTQVCVFCPFDTVVACSGSWMVLHLTHLYSLMRYLTHFACSGMTWWSLTQEITPVCVHTTKQFGHTQQFSYSCWLSEVLCPDTGHLGNYC